ncbi:hypothetical protein DSM110093_03839 (plasmid) [Sulfitobacter sp. DSM 110093]|uniref:efflux RND transporter permease subunit n=1 Tax=Sulfitobacter sp. DSM 110093 TaxID=2883127 RepID=UPI001FAB8AE7|nr:MMPL family transporter [Sulfitobacter sp. DSM 110093]UOA33743.1 hypothetical protein DSM110093_03578 [Sulfitobacter sp. DSM 110093]UOA34004.1 hypothetical protein DSM110093_03839 [Sulfitobacter sp. DSM 110093]
MRVKHKAHEGRLSTRRIAHYIVTHDVMFFMLGAVILLIASLGLLRLSFSSDNRDFFGASNPDINAVLQLEDTYSKSDTLIFAVVGEEDICTPQGLTRLRAFTEEAWLLPDVLRVDSVANFNHSYADGDDIIIEPLLSEDTDLGPEDAQRVKDIALTSTELVHRLVAPDCNAFGIFIDLVPSENASIDRLDMAERARALKADWQARAPDLNIHVSGGVIGGVSINEAAQRDMRQLVPLSFAVVTLLMLLGLGTISGWLATTLVTLGGTLATLGFAGWMGIALIPATATSPLAVMVLITASCVHVVLGWARRMAQNQDRLRATYEAVEENLTAVSVTNITTAIGFLCLNFSESPPLAQMGTIVAFGIVVGWLLTGMFLPLILRRAPALCFKPVHIPGHQLEKLASFALHKRGLVSLFGLATVLALLGLSQIRFNDSALRYFDESFSFRTDNDAIEEHLTGMESVHFSFQAPEGHSVFSPEFLSRVDNFTNWVRTQDKVLFVGTVTDVLKRLNQTLDGGAQDSYQLAPTQQGNAQAMMLYELSLPVGQDMNQMMNIDRSKTRLTVVLRGADGQDIAQFAQRSEAWLRENEPQIATDAVGVGVAFSKLTQRNNQAMIYGMLTVLVLVSALMTLSLRNLRLGLISLVPNVVPAILAFGLWGWLIGDVNLGSTVVTTMTFGIVVDDTVHIMIHYNRHRRRGLDREAALRLTFRTVGTALMVTSVAISSGFFIMTQSGFLINQHLGGLTTIVIVLALFTDLILLPAVLERTKL